MGAGNASRTVPLEAAQRCQLEGRQLGLERRGQLALKLANTLDLTKTSTALLISVAWVEAPVA